MKNVLFPFPRKDLRIGRSPQTRKPPGSTSNPAPSHARSRLFREVAVPCPDPTASAQPLRGTHASSCCWASEQSSLSLRQINTPPLHTTQRPAAAKPQLFPASPSAQGHFRPRLPTTVARKLQTAHARAESRRAGGGGAQARTVPGWAPGRPRSCLLLPPARGSRRANGFQPRPRRPNGWPGAPRCSAALPLSGSLGRLGLVRGRVRVRAFALRCPRSCPCRCPRSLHPPARLVAPGSPGAAPASSLVPVGLGGPAGGCFAPSLQAAQVASAAGNLPVRAGPLRADAGSGGGTLGPSPKGPLGFEKSLEGPRG